MMSDIKQKWFNALDKQHQVLSLNEKIMAKLDKVNDVQHELGLIIDKITHQIETKEVDEVNGQSACMII